jgi:hypothetical protein
MKRKATTTVDEFFTWYSGTSEWREDWQITNTMIVGGAHAQDDDYYGEFAIERLVKYKDETIEVTGNDDNVNGTWEHVFTLKGKRYRVQASAFFGEEGY